MEVGGHDPKLAREKHKTLSEKQAKNKRIQAGDPEFNPQYCQIAK
jgi:hypothetical protein